MFSASLLSKFMNSPIKLHLNAVKRVLKYSKRKIDFNILYERGKELILEGYINSDSVNNFDDGKSTGGYFSLGLGPFSLN